VCECVDGPVMSHSHVKIAVDAHQSTALVCSARAWPDPTMTWFRNFTLLSITDVTKYHITRREDADGQFPVVSVLNISNIEQDDLGIYSCTARNDMGVNVTDFVLSVRSELVF